MRTKRVEFVVHLTGAAPAASDGYVKAQLPRRIEGIRAIWLMNYSIIGAAAGLYQLRLGNQVFVDQENAFGQPGYMLLNNGVAGATYGGAPRLISKHGIPQLTDLDCQLLTRLGQPLVFTEASFIFEIQFDDPEAHHSLDAVAAEAGMYEPVHGQNNWRASHIPDKATQDQTIAQLAAGVFSHSPF